MTPGMNSSSPHQHFLREAVYIFVGSLQTAWLIFVQLSLTPLLLCKLNRPAGKCCSSQAKLRPAEWPQISTDSQCSWACTGAEA